MSLLAPISVGELFDKLSILELKAAAIVDPARRANVERERAALEAVRRCAVPPLPELDRLYRELQDVNRRLWQTEDALRAHERAATFHDAFIALARSVYRQNDRRAALKRRINELTGSEIVEEKSYPEYDRPGG
jgi:3-methyladenine DNA glycosylase/8-oxoguanine DNA glycosylase